MAQGRVANDASADFPVQVGAPYRVGQTVYTPQDTMNYDAVGHAVVETDAEAGIAAAHHTLPVPSYVEVTDLESGHTILARVDRRGPMNSDAVIALSAAAAAQLGIGDGAAVRVRRVNPPEPERAMLRSGGSAPARMDTPAPLLTVLKRRLQGGAVALTPVSAGAAQVGGAAPYWATPGKALGTGGPPKRATGRVAIRKPVTPAPPMPRIDVDRALTDPKPEPTGVPDTHNERQPVDSALRVAHHSGAFAVQLGSFAEKAHAEALAQQTGARVERNGQLWRVRKGPYASRGAAAAALGKMAGAGGAKVVPAD